MIAHRLAATWLFVTCYATIGLPAAAGPAQKIVLQLGWDHQFQFAGYYAALWQGYYADASFDVEIRSAFPPGGKFRSPMSEVAEGRADFGIAGADILLAIDKGAPLRIVASVFQRSPVAFYAKAETGVASPADLTRLRVGVRPRGIAGAELRAMLREEGIDPKLVQLRPIESDLGIDDIASGNLDVAAGFTISAGWLAHERGLTLTALRPATYGVDFYGSAIFVHRRWIEKAPEAVQRFVAASLKGWNYALIGPVAIADRISRDLARSLPVSDAVAFNRSQVEPVVRLINFPATDLGNTNPARWMRMRDALREAGLIQGSFDAADVIFDVLRLPQQQADRLTRIVIWVLAAGLAAGAAAWGWYAWRNHRDRQRANATLRESEQRLRAIAERLPGVVFRRILHRDGRMSYTYTSAIDRDGMVLPPETIRGDADRFVDIIHPEDRSMWRQTLEQSAASLSPYDIVIRVPSKSGELRWFHSKARPCRGEDGDIIWDGLALDITDRKKAEERAREHKAELAHVLRLGTIEEMASAYAHEIKQPLVAIYNYARGCSLRLESGRFSTDDLKEILERISQQAERASKVVRNIADFVRKGEITFAETDANELVRTVAELAEVDLERGRVKLRLDLADGLPTVMMNRIEMEQVVLNLVRNGIEAMRDVPSNERTLTIGTGRDGEGSVSIVVSDTGPGIPESETRLFEPFFTTKPDGLGMGLAIARTIVEAHAGHIQAERKAGRGAVFRITLPVRQMAEADA